MVVASSQGTQIATLSGLSKARVGFYTFGFALFLLKVMFHETTNFLLMPAGRVSQR